MFWQQAGQETDKLIKKKKCVVKETESKAPYISMGDIQRNVCLQIAASSICCGVGTFSQQRAEGPLTFL